jgi:hypothetical protein
MIALYTRLRRLVANDQHVQLMRRPRPIFYGMNYKIGEPTAPSKFFHSLDLRHLRMAPFKLFYTPTPHQVRQNTARLTSCLLLSSVCGNTFYHTGSILLLQTGNVRHDRTCVDADKVDGYSSGYVVHHVMLTPKSQYDPFWHAKELGGISMSNTSQYVQYPLFEAAASTQTT